MKGIVVLFAMITSIATTLAQTPKKSELVSVRGKKLYYEKHGKGTPLIFLHGYSLSSNHWKPYVADFKHDYEVYLIDLTGHGKSDPFEETLSIKEVAKDLDALLQYLQLDNIKAIGFSFGGDVLFHLALLRPSLIESMITIGAVGTWDVNDFPQYLQGYTFENREKFPWLKESHESEQHIKGLMDQFKHYTVYLTEENLSAIQPEVLVMMGDDDEGMDFAELARVKKHLPNSDIWVLPNVSHGAHQGENKGEFVAVSKQFLSKK